MALREVILLQKVVNVGNIGDVVNVRPGFARNFLIPNGKALPATKINREKFQAMKAELEAKSNAQKADAEKQAEKLNGLSMDIIRQASDTGVLYGTIRPRDVAEALATQHNITIDRSIINFKAPVKELGEHEAFIALHAEVEASVKLNITRM